MSESEQIFEKMLSEAGIPTTEAGMRGRWDTINAEEGSQITNNSAWSPFWRLVSAIVTAPALWLVRLLVRHALPNTFLKFATGTYLDIYCWGVDLERHPATYAEGTVLFTRAEASGNLTIPKGTIIESPAIAGVTHRVATLRDAVIPEGQLGLEVDVRAEQAGAAANLGPGYYSILPVPVPGIVTVANGDDWLVSPGSDEETDEAFRLRARAQFQAVGQYHHDAGYRQIVTEHFGVRADYVYFEKDGPRGPGTANGYLMLESGIPPASLVERVNAFIMESGNHGHGDDIRFFAMPDLPVELTVTVYPQLSCGEERREALRTDVENAVRSAFRENLDVDVTRTLPRSRFSFSQLDHELHAMFPDLRSVEFSLQDIVSELSLPTLRSLTVRLGDGI